MTAIRVRVQDFNRHPDAVYVGRRNGFVPKGMARATQFGNPFKMRYQTPNERSRVVQLYHHHLLHSPALLRAMPALRDRKLACWCDLEVPCHVDSLLRLLARYSDEQLMALAGVVDRRRVYAE